MAALKTELRGDMAELKADMQKIMSGIHRVVALVEEQSSRNRYVLDGYQSLYERQGRVEKDVFEVKKVLKL